MPAPITDITLSDQFEPDVRNKWNNAIGLLDDETIDSLADSMAADSAIGTVGRGTASTDLSTDFWILYGCQISGTNPGSRTVTAGAILYQNQVYHVSAKTVTTTGSDVVYWNIVDNSPNVHVRKEIAIYAGVSGSGIKDEGDTRIFRYGQWIESSSPSSGLALSFTSNTTVTFNTDTYKYKYRRVGNALEINFFVTANITAGASNVTKIFIPLPDGFTKKQPSSSSFCIYGNGRYDKPTSTSAYLPMLVKDYDDGTEGNKIVLLRNTSSDALGGTIIMDNSGTITLRGNITLEIQ